LTPSWRQMTHSRNEQQIKEKISKAATQLIAEKGFSKLKYLDLSQKAGVSVVTLRKYFKTKNDVLAEIFASVWNEIMNTIHEELRESAGNNEDTLIKKIFACIINFLLLEENQERCFVLLFESRQKGYINHIIYPSPVENFIKLLRNLFESGQKKGIFLKNIPVDKMERLVWGWGEESLYRSYIWKYKNEFGNIDTLRSAPNETPEDVIGFLDIILQNFRSKK